MPLPPLALSRKSKRDANLLPHLAAARHAGHADPCHPRGLQNGLHVLMRILELHFGRPICHPDSNIHARPQRPNVLIWPSGSPPAQSAGTLFRVGADMSKTW